MFYVRLRTLPRQLLTLAVAVAAIALVLLAPTTSRAQRSKGASDGDDLHPAFSDFKGVRIGMTADEARKKLGSPESKDADQDFYQFDANESAQVFYDKGAVMAISINYLKEAKAIPTCKEILGVDADIKSDGSVYKLVRYPRAGFWVSYSRTAGNDPMTIITMQRIQ